MFLKIKTGEFSIKREYVGVTEISTSSAGFTYRLDRLKPRASRFRGPPAKVFNIFNTVIGLSHLCCHNVRYFLDNPSVIFLTQFQNMVEF